MTFFYGKGHQIYCGWLQFDVKMIVETQEKIRIANCTHRSMLMNFV